jgi:hypothetical protein
MRRWQTEIQFYRVRRTLSEVKSKLEEALRLSRHQSDKEYARPTASHRHR